MPKTTRDKTTNPLMRDDKEDVPDNYRVIGLPDSSASMFGSGIPGRESVARPEIKTAPENREYELDGAFKLERAYEEGKRIYFKVRDRFSVRTLLFQAPSERYFEVNVSSFTGDVARLLRVEGLYDLRVRDGGDPYPLLGEFPGNDTIPRPTLEEYVLFRQQALNMFQGFVDDVCTDNSLERLSAQPVAPTSGKADTQSEKHTLTVTEAAKIYQEQVSRSITLGAAKSLLSKKCKQREGFATTGSDGKPRISEAALGALILEDNTRDMRPRGRNASDDASDDDLYEVS